MATIKFTYKGTDPQLRTLYRISQYRMSFDNVVPLPDGVEDNPWERFLSLLIFIDRKHNFEKIVIDRKFCEDAALANGGYIAISLQLTNRICNLRCKNLNSEAINPSEWSRMFGSLPELNTLVMQNGPEEALLHASRHCKQLERLYVKKFALLEHTLDELLDFPELVFCGLNDLDIGYTSPKPTLLEFERLSFLSICPREGPDNPLIQNLVLTIIAPGLQLRYIYLSQKLWSLVHIDNCVAYNERHPLRPEE